MSLLHVYTGEGVFEEVFQSKEMNCTIVGPNISRHCWAKELYSGSNSGTKIPSSIPVCVSTSSEESWASGKLEKMAVFQKKFHTTTVLLCEISLLWSDSDWIKISGKSRVSVSMVNNLLSIWWCPQLNNQLIQFCFSHSLHFVLSTANNSLSLSLHLSLFVD